MRRSALAAVAACLLLFATLLIPATSSAANCPPGHSSMGCGVPPGHPTSSRRANPEGRPEIPDVSDNNGPVDWSAVKHWQIVQHGWPGAGIVKIGEYVEDPDAQASIAALHSLGMVAIGYVFVRPGLQAQTVIDWATSLGIQVVVLDEEVLGIQGIAGQITPALKAAGLTVIGYHAQANVLDTTAQGLPCWTADIGPTSPPRCTTGKTIAWQFSWTGSVPGISHASDLSIGLGILAIAQRAAHLAAMQYWNYDTTPRFAGKIVERRAVRSWDSDRCVNPVRRRKCWILRAHLQLLRARLVGLHQSGKRWSYGKPVSIGLRNQQLYHRIIGRHVITSWKGGL